MNFSRFFSRNYYQKHTDKAMKFTKSRSTETHWPLATWASKIRKKNRGKGARCSLSPKWKEPHFLFVACFPVKNIHSSLSRERMKHTGKSRDVGWHSKWKERMWSETNCITTAGHVDSFAVQVSRFVLFFNLWQTYCAGFGRFLSRKTIK